MNFGVNQRALSFCWIRPIGIGLIFWAILGVSQPLFAEPVRISQVPVETLAKKIIVTMRPDANLWTLSTAFIRSKRPKPSRSLNDSDAWLADEAWLLIAFDKSKRSFSTSILWNEASRGDIPLLDQSRFILPGGVEQAGPRPDIGYASECGDDYVLTDEFGIGSLYSPGCSKIRSYSVPITIDVLRYLAERQDILTPLRVSLVSDKNAEAAVRRTFNFYPAEAKALLSKFDSLFWAKSSGGQ